MAKCTVAQLVSLKCEESNHYSSNCLLCQRCWLLCTSYGEYKAARTCEDLKRGAPQEFLFNPHIEHLYQQRIQFYKI